MLPVYIHGWPDGKVDTATLANRLRDCGLGLLEIAVDPPADGATLDEVVSAYVQQIPADRDVVLIGYCGAARYGMYIGQALEQRGQVPVALLAVDSLNLHGRYALTQKFNGVRPIPFGVKLRRQAERVLQPYNESIRDVAVEWLKVALGLRSRLRRLLGREESRRNRAQPVDFAWMRPLTDRTLVPFKQLVVTYNVAGIADDVIFGTAGTMAPFYSGPVLTRSFESEDHAMIASDPEAISVARVLADDYVAISEGRPLSPHLHIDRMGS